MVLDYKDHIMKLEGQDYINFYLNKQNTYYCEHCPHSMEWHSSLEGHHCQFCRFNDTNDFIHLNLDLRNSKDMPWQAVLDEITASKS